MKCPRICAVVTSPDLDEIKSAHDSADLFELRIDLIGPQWRDIPALLTVPWIATNRTTQQGGKRDSGDAAGKEELRAALKLGAAMVDIDLGTPDLNAFVSEIKPQAECIISYHDFGATPTGDLLSKIVLAQIEAGADICKVVTTALTIADNLTVLHLLKQFPDVKMVALAMGETGRLSRFICPLAGGAFTFAMMREGKGSAAGQIPLVDLRRLYQVMGYD